MSMLKIPTRIHKAITVGFTDLKIHCSIGILPHEREKVQEIIISLKIQFYIDEPMQDDLCSTIDYSILAQICQEAAVSKHHELLETLGCEILDRLFDQFSAAYGWIRIEKPAAIATALCGFVEYERGLKR
jgi:7,8-dihydroneopterin aldolase/epimerase/oxygenase